MLTWIGASITAPAPPAGASSAGEYGTPEIAKSASPDSTAARPNSDPCAE